MKSKPLRILILVFITLFIVIFVIVYLQIYGFIAYSEAFGFLSGLLAGMLGILIGFSLDRVSDVDKDNQTKNDFLNLIREELTDTKNSIYPQKNGVYLLYTDIWDSVISSGIIRLLDTEQVTKLSRIYKQIKGVSYEAVWVRNNSEEWESIPDSESTKKECAFRKYDNNCKNHYKRMANLSKQIDDVLKEKWWNKIS